MTTTKPWQNYFPYDTYREGQERAISKIIDKFENGANAIFLEAPTGAGKSAIGYTIGSYFGDYYYITAQKILQEQLTRDFGENGLFVKDDPMIELKGRNAYPCNYYERQLADSDIYNNRYLTDDRKRVYEKRANEGINCAKGECKRRRKSKLDYCRGHCPYFNQLERAMRSNGVLMNFHSFIYQTEMVPQRWDKKNLLIIDEAHNAEQVLMDYVSMRLTDVSFDTKFPELDSPEEYLIFFEDIDLLGQLKQHLAQSIENNDDEMEEYWSRQILRYNKFRDTFEDEEWTCKYEKKDKFSQIELKPLFIRSWSHPLLFDKADKVLFMSATILNVGIMRSSLAISKKDSWAYRLPNRFPIKNRKIYYQPSGSMSFKNKHETLPKLVQDVIDICEKHEGEKGIIHTHNFEIAKRILEKSPNHISTRLLFQEHFYDKDALLRAHNESDDTIIIAPAMHEGLDLKNDLSRFQIICKVPYPSFVDNPQLKRRMEISNDFYAYLCALKITQCYGRSIRSENDYAITYVLDKDFKSFVGRSNKVLPPWFVEAIVWN